MFGRIRGGGRTRWGPLVARREPPTRVTALRPVQPDRPTDRERQMAIRHLFASPQLRRRFGARAFIATCLVTLVVSPAAAAHRARLSSDLAEHLANDSQKISIIVHGDKATVDAIAARYNVPVRRHLRSGAVLRVTAGQLAALAADDRLDHL